MWRLSRELFGQRVNTLVGKKLAAQLDRSGWWGQSEGGRDRDLHILKFYVDVDADVHDCLSGLINLLVLTESECTERKWRWSWFSSAQKLGLAESCMFHFYCLSFCCFYWTSVEVFGW